MEDGGHFRAQGEPSFDGQVPSSSVSFKSFLKNQDGITETGKLQLLRSEASTMGQLVSSTESIVTKCIVIALGGST